MSAPAVSPAATLTERFQAFHDANPDFYDHLVALAREYLAATGSSRVSIQRCIEIARWRHDIETESADGLKVNNDFGAFYSRLIELQEPDLYGVFAFRRADEADEWIAALHAQRDEQVQYGTDGASLFDLFPQQRGPQGEQ